MNISFQRKPLASEDVQQKNSDTPSETRSPNRCYVRPDSSGLLNVIKAWYLFALHTILVVAIAAGTISIDGLGFNIGSPPNAVSYHGRLYQTQVTAILSIALVVLRIFSGSCSVLLGWRTVFILLEKRGISLGELARLISWRVPLFSWKNATKDPMLVWVIWATVVFTLLWPSSFAAPLATSSLSWIPGQSLDGESVEVKVRGMFEEGGPGRAADWAALNWEEPRQRAIIDAAVMASRQAKYAFLPDPGDLVMRNYFRPINLDDFKDFPTHSKMDLEVPYFAVDLTWIDRPSEDSRVLDVTKSDRVGIDSLFTIRKVGTTAIMRDEAWLPERLLPWKQEVLRKKVLLGVKTGGWDFPNPLPDGTPSYDGAPCPTFVHDFGELPDVEQWRRSWKDHNEKETAFECYMFAEANIVSGIYDGKGCNVTASEENIDEKFATCYIDRDDDSVKPDFLSSVSVDFISETIKYARLLNYIVPDGTNLDQWTRGMLTLGYHAAWSSIMIGMAGEADARAAVWPSTPIVNVSVHRPSVYGFLGMHVALTLSGILVFIAQHFFSREKAVCDTTLAALTMDLTEVSHSARSSGLCNAVKLSRADGKLPRMRWKKDLTRARDPETSSAGADDSCIRTVAFVYENESLMAAHAGEGETGPAKVGVMAGVTAGVATTVSS